MRIFWAIIALLTIAALAAWFTRGHGKSEALAPARPEAAPKFKAAAEDAGLRADGSLAPSGLTNITPKPTTIPTETPRNDSTSTMPGTQMPVEAQPGKADSPKTDPANAQPVQPAPIATEASKPTEVPPEFFTDLDSALHALVGDPAAPKPVPAAPHSPSPARPTDSKPADSKPVTPDTPLPPAKIVPQSDGSVMIDDKYPLKGKGSKDDPYRLTWDQLVSAERTYQPRLGRKQIPERVKMLDGKWIRIGGYIAFPLMAQSADEMLMMLNQWDGCCIGVPPTPYDAIEVKLKKAVKGDDRLRATGTLTGILRVDPYLVKDWLVSLYVMDDGELSDLGGETPPPAEHQK